MKHFLAGLFIGLFVSFLGLSAVAKTLPRALKPTELPANCLSDQVYPCAVQTESGVRWEHISEGFRIVINERSSLVLISAGALRLVDGVAWVEAQKTSTVKSVYGEIVGIGEFWLRQNKKSVHVGVHSGRAHLYPRDGREALTVNVGMQNWMGRADKEGRSMVGIPQTVLLAEHMDYWTRMNVVSRARFDNDARVFMHRWQASAKESSMRQKLMAKRHIASVQERRHRWREKRDRYRAKESEMRELFRRRNYIN